MNKILFIDTSGRFSKIMLFCKAGVLSQRTTSELNQHAQLINRHVQEILKEAQTSMTELAAVCVLNGPGSYTGLRIGLSSAKGFCYAYDIPLILLNHLDLLYAIDQMPESDRTYILKARENEYFVKSFSKISGLLSEINIATADEIRKKVSDEKCFLISDDSDLTADFDHLTLLEIDDFKLNGVIFEHFHAKKFADLMHSEPFYLKNVYINKIKNT